MSQQEIWDSVQESSCPANLSIRPDKSWAALRFRHEGSASLLLPSGLYIWLLALDLSEAHSSEAN